MGEGTDIWGHADLYFYQNDSRNKACTSFFVLVLITFKCIKIRNLTISFDYLEGCRAGNKKRIFVFEFPTWFIFSLLGRNTFYFICFINLFARPDIFCQNVFLVKRYPKFICFVQQTPCPQFSEVSRSHWVKFFWKIRYSNVSSEWYLIVSDWMIIRCRKFKLSFQGAREVERQKTFEFVIYRGNGDYRSTSDFSIMNNNVTDCINDYTADSY